MREWQGNHERGGRGGGGYWFVACLSHFTIDHASLSRRSTGKGKEGRKEKRGVGGGLAGEGGERE